MPRGKDRKPRIRRKQPLIPRLFSKVLIPFDGNGCWLWTGAVYTGYNYGSVRIDGKGVLAHRVFYHLAHPDFPIESDGRVLDHLCRVHQCVNPEHLEVVTHRENCTRGKASNLKSDKKGPYPGVRRHGRGWSAEYKVGSVQRYLGTFDTPEEAYDKYLEAINGFA